MYKSFNFTYYKQRNQEKDDDDDEPYAKLIRIINGIQ